MVIAHTPSLLYAVKQVELAVRARLDTIVKPSKITALQYTALTVLERHDGISAAQLARNSFITAQSMADLVGTLQRRGFIDRRQDPTNRRRLLISLTADGRKLLADHETEVRALEDRMLNGLSSREVATLRRTLNNCRASLADEREE